jgi:hypothetical protein
MLGVGVGVAVAVGGTATDNPAINARLKRKRFMYLAYLP